ncbi:membrane protein YczE [Arthrobacter sp. TMT4-20]
MSHLFLRRVPQLLVGLFCYGFAIAMMIQAGIGVSPWDVLGQGVALQSGLPFGVATNIIGLLVLLLWIPIRQKPGIGTVLNVALVGPSAEVGLAILPMPTELWAQILLFTGGLTLLALATGLYIGARMGPGPRDGLMTGINRKWGWKIWKVRTLIELTVLAIGWVLGGTVGVGTVAFALLIGPMVNAALPLLHIPDPRPRGGAAGTAAPAT